jgi:hypothetical protein
MIYVLSVNFARKLCTPTYAMYAKALLLSRQQCVSAIATPANTRYLNISLILIEKFILFIYPLGTHLQLTFLCELSESSFALLVVCPVTEHYSRGITAKGWELRVLLFPA